LLGRPQNKGARDAAGGKERKPCNDGCTVVMRLRSPPPSPGLVALPFLCHFLSPLPPFPHLTRHRIPHGPGGFVFSGSGVLFLLVACFGVGLQATPNRAKATQERRLKEHRPARHKRDGRPRRCSYREAAAAEQAAQSRAPSPEDPCVRSLQRVCSRQVRPYGNGAGRLTAAAACAGKGFSTTAPQRATLCYPTSGAK
jgi:hypothetical protein